MMEEKKERKDMEKFSESWQKWGREKRKKSTFNQN